jgi:pimeloyl-ACP methyl ester carboxylesterase
MQQAAARPRRSLQPMRDSTTTLADGRALAYTDIGAADAPVVIYCHGAPTSRLDLVGLEDALATLGVRVIAPDRPGYGGSSPQPGRTLAGWPGDVAALADHLGVERFAVIGYSSGGPYAVVCAALLGDRVAASGVVAGVTDMAWEPAWDGFDAAEVELMRVGNVEDAVAWCEARYGADGRGYLGGEELPPMIREAFRQGVAGYAQDATLQAQAWAFDPGAISVPVSILHGEADDFVPVTHARHTAELIPTASLRIWPEHGHLTISSEIPSLAATLVGGLRPPG